MAVEDLLVTLVISLSPMTPIALAAIGEIVAEKSGVVNIGLEGILLISAWTSAFATLSTGSIAAGYFAGLVTGALLGLLHGLISVKLKGDQIITGVGLNIAAVGLTAVLTRAVWGNYGQSPPIETKSPGLILMGQRISLLFFLAVAVAVAAWYILEKTMLGVKIKAVGDDPRSAEALGVNVDRVRIAATIVGGMLTGLGGAFLSIDYIGGFVKLMSAGKGFIALADVAFSGWNPLYALLGAFIFGYSDALARYYAITSGAIGATASSYLIKTVPYIVTLLAIMLTAKRAVAPRELGKPYFKE